MKTYKIIRFYSPMVNRKDKVVMRHLTLMEAQKWCNDPSTAQKNVYFDGYTEEND